MTARRSDPPDAHVATLTDSHVDHVGVVAPLDVPPGPGDRVGRYVIEKELGVGGMGVVFAARDPELARSVAIKVLRDRGGDAVRLLREAQALAQISHPNVVHVYEVGSHHGQVFVAMELVDGVTLDRHLAQGHGTWRDVLALFVAAGRGLAAVHAQGLVHRDVKPSNILVDRGGRVRIGDFGLARQDAPSSTATPTPRAPLAEERPRPDAHAATLDATTGSSEPPTSSPLLASPLTQAGAVVGTPSYMAPEQIRGERVTRQADQFALCIALWEALYGEHPFGADRRALLDAIEAGARRPAPPGKGVPRWLERTVARGLAHDPADRWPTIDALIGELERAPRRQRRRRTITALALAAAASAVAVVILVRPHAAAPPAPDGYDEGVWALRRDDGRAAVTALERATRVDPSYVRAWIALARAYQLVPDVPRAKAAIARAASLVAAGDHVRRLEIDGLAAELDEKREVATERYREYLGFIPDDLEVGAALADVQLVGGNPRDALATVKVLRARADDPRLAILEARADAALSDWIGAEASADHAVALARAAGAPLVLARAAAWRGLARASKKQLAAGLADLAWARGLAHALGDRALEARVLTKRTRVLGESGDTAGAAAVADEAIAIDREIGDESGLASDLVNAASSYGALGKIDRSSALYEEVFPLLRKLDEKDLLANALLNHAADLIDQGERTEADRALREGLDVARSAGYDALVGNAMGNLAWNDFGRGDVDQSEREYREGITLSERVGDKQAVVYAYDGLAIVLDARGDRAGALRAEAQAAELASHLDAQALATEQAWLAIYLLADGQAERAATTAVGAIDGLRARQDDRDEAIAVAAAAAAFAALGRHADAAPHLARGRALLDRPIPVDYKARAARLLMAAAVARGDRAGARAIFDALPRARVALPWAQALEAEAARLGVARAQTTRQ